MPIGRLFAAVSPPSTGAAIERNVAASGSEVTSIDGCYRPTRARRRLTGSDIPVTLAASPGNAGFARERGI